MGYPDREGDDLNMAVKQVKKLLKCDVKKVKRQNDRVLELEYTCPKVPEGKGTKKGKILYVRPYPKNIRDFKDDLKSKEQTKQQDESSLYKCIEKQNYQCYGEKPDIPFPLSLFFKNPNKDDLLDVKYQFPQTDTMLTSYDPKLIRAYYLLGKFIGEHDVAPEIKKQLENQTR
jgi:hypothetical protein